MIESHSESLGDIQDEYNRLINEHRVYTEEEIAESEWCIKVLRSFNTEVIYIRKSPGDRFIAKNIADLYKKVNSTAEVMRTDEIRE